MPFLAHALGVAFKIIQMFRAPKLIAAGIALAIALLFLWGGLATSKSINSPETPMLVDAVLCYIPMAIAVIGLLLEAALKEDNLSCFQISAFLHTTFCSTLSFWGRLSRRFFGFGRTRCFFSTFFSLFFRF